MAFTISDFEDLVRLLGEHPEWQARLRPVILGEEVLSIPSRMDRVEAALERLAERVEGFAERQEAFERRMEAFERRMEAFDKRLDRMDGRLSNLEGTDLEGRYDRHMGSWFSKWVRRAEKMSSAELDVLYDAVADGRITEEELDHIHHLDLLVRGANGALDGDETLVLAVEVSYTVNLDDVNRAHTRARSLNKAGFRARGFVGGYRATDEATDLAKTLDVIIDLHRPAA